MNESSVATSKTSMKKKLVAGAAAAVLIAGGAGVLVSRTGLDEKLAKEKLDQIVASMKEQGRAEGRDIDLTYEKIEMTGGLLGRHAVVVNPVFTLKPYNPKLVTPDPQDELRVTTSEMDIFGASYDLSAVKLSLPKPLDFAGGDAPEKSLLKIEAASPIEATISQKKVGETPYLEVSHTPPTSLALTYLKEKHAEGQEDATPSVVPVYDTIQVTIAGGSSIRTSMAQDGSGLGSADVSVGQITTAPKSAPDGVITVAGIQGKWRNSVDKNEAGHMLHQWNVGPITADNKILAYAPMKLVLDFAFDGPGADDKDGKKSQGKIALKQLELSTKDATLSANADFVTTETDMLPVGTAALKLTNVPLVREELKKRGILKPENESWVAELLQRITGTPYADLKDLNVAIERPQGGQFKIGNSTFEEVVATFLKHALHIDSNEQLEDGADDAGEEEGAAPHVPQLPDASKEKAKPIEVPDHGSRG